MEFKAIIDSGSDATAFWKIISENLETKDVISLSRVKELLGGTLKLASAELVELQKKEAVVLLDDDTAGDTLCEVPDAQFLEPRGRFKTVMSNTGIHLEGKSASGFVPWASVTHAAVLPAAQTSKKEGEDLLMMRLAPGKVTFNGKILKNLLWNMQKVVGKPLSIVVKDASVAVGPHMSESDIVALLVGKAWGKKLVRPRPDLFVTVASKDPKPFLHAHRGTQDGVLYPLETGVLFLKPALFLPAEEISSINAGRGAGGQTRFVDLLVETVDDSTHEFTNIERDELPALQGYVKGYLEVQAAKRAAERAAVADVDDEDDSDEEDDDYDENEDSADSEEDSDDSDEDDSDDYAEEDDETEDEEEEKDEKKKKKSVPVKEEAAEPSEAKKEKNKEKKREKDIRKKVSPKKRGSAKQVKTEDGVKKEEGAPLVVDLSSFSSSSSAMAPPVDPVAAMKAAYQKSFQVTREREGEENVPAENKKVKVEGESAAAGGEGMDVEVDPSSAKATPAQAPPATVFVLDE